jgi:LPXTG-motif cell wall-anchored protein
MRSLAAVYAILALLGLPAVLWAADDRPPPAPGATTTEAATTTTEAPPPPATTPAVPAPSPKPKPKPAAPDPVSVAAESAPAARASASGGVTIQNFAFAPKTVTVSQGDTVSWTNRDGTAHSATADDGSFDTGLLDKGSSATHTFSQAGTFQYHCTPHPFMTATVVVRAASTGGGAQGGAAGNGSGSTGSGTTGSTSTSTSPSTGPSLPSTGLDVALVALAGLALVGGGAALRRRLQRS